MMVMYALTPGIRSICSGGMSRLSGCRPVSTMRDSPSRSRRTMSGRRTRLWVPRTKSTAGARPKMASPSCCATHPATPISRGRSRPRPMSCSTRAKTFSCAFSRTEQVFRTTTSAGPASAGRQPSDPRAAAIFSESWTFIWQPQVSIRNRRWGAGSGGATGPPGASPVAADRSGARSVIQRPAGSGASPAPSHPGDRRRPPRPAIGTRVCGRCR